MLSTNAAAVLTLVTMIVACVLGVAAGLLACLVLRLPWGPKAAAIDVGVAAMVVIITGVVLAAIETVYHAEGSPLEVICMITIASVVVRHTIRFALRASR